MAEESHVLIGLKDVYQQVQVLERSLTDTLATLNITMTQIKGHLEQVDTRNQAADTLHKEFSDRLRAHDSKLGELAALDAYRRWAKTALWTAIGSGGAAVAALVTVIEHMHH